MKLIKYRVLLIAIVIFGLLSNRTGRNEGSTGAPDETDNVTCANCHIRGPFKPGISIELLSNNLKVQVIKPNTDYTVNIQLTDSTAKASVYGFQLVPLNSSNAMAGSFPALGTRVKRVNDIGRTYLSHSARSATSLFTATWRSPATIAVTDSIRFYFSGVTGNDDGGSIGDNAVLGTRTFYPEGGLTSSEEVAVRMPTLVQNIGSEILNFSNFENVKRIKIFDTNGRIILSEYVNGKNYADISTLGYGYFYIQFITDTNSVTRKFLKI
jgi:hypothetical protein